MNCPKCGKSIVDDSIFCNYCGTRITNGSSSSKRTQFDVYTTKDGKYERLGILNTDTKRVTGNGGNTIFTFDKKKLHSTKTGITYTVDREGKIFDNALQVGFIKDYVDSPEVGSIVDDLRQKVKEFGIPNMNFGSTAESAVLTKVTICLLLFELIMHFLPIAFRHIQVSLFGDTFDVMKSFVTLAFSTHNAGIILLDIIMILIPIILLFLIWKNNTRKNLFLTIGGIASTAIMFIIPSAVLYILTHEDVYYHREIRIGYSAMFYVMMLGYISITVIGIMGLRKVKK